jgi:phosphate transport system permease protein
LALTAAIVLLFLTVGAFALGRRRALALVGPGLPALHSRPHHYGQFVALGSAFPALLVAVAFQFVFPPLATGILEAAAPAEIQRGPQEALALWVEDARRLAAGEPVGREVDAALQSASDRVASLARTGQWAHLALAFAAGALGLGLALRRVEGELRARPIVEGAVGIALAACSALAILVTIGIVLSLVFEAARFFAQVSPAEFLFGTKWSPQTALRADQVGASGTFGAVPVFAGTLLITLIAMVVAVPVGLLSAVYLSEYASPRMRSVVKPLLEILAGIPTVVYGFFAALSVAPWVRKLGEALGLEVASESALAAGLVMGVMIIPFVSSLSDDVISAVPGALREGSLGLGATRSETVVRVVLPAALPGIVGSVLLAVSRAIGETMIVVMAAGLAANLTANPFAAVTTVTVQIVTLLVGDQEFDSAKTLAAFALGLLLFCVTLALNVIALHVVRRYREAYD